jgi:hypothetical protein
MKTQSLRSPKTGPIERCGRIYGALNHNATRSFVA